MGTSLTGLTPSTTYDALIKVGDNGPLSATAKVLSDGLGNDSPLAMSTTLVGIGTATPAVSLNVEYTDITSYLEGIRVKNLGNSLQSQSKISCYNSSNNFIELIQNSATLNGDALIYTNTAPLAFNISGTERMRITAAGNVGIGKTAPDTKLHVAGADAWITLQRTSGTTNILDFTDSTSRIGYVGAIGSNISILSTGSVVFGANSAEVARFTANGLTFNGDTAAANALDDYEEGTWTPVLRGSSTPGTYELGTTYGNYTKIGRQVTLNAVITLSGSITGGGLGYLQITGVPFTKSSTQEALGSCWFVGVDFTGSFVVPRFVATSATSTLYFIETVDNANPIDLPISGISASDVLNLSITYFV